MCCLGSRSFAIVMPNDDWRNHGIDILRRLLAGLETATFAVVVSDKGGALAFPSSSLASMIVAEDVGKTTAMKLTPHLI